MLTSILIALMIVAGNMVGALTFASGVLIASGVINPATRTDRVCGAGMAVLGTLIFALGSFITMAS